MERWRLDTMSSTRTLYNTTSKRILNKLFVFVPQLAGLNDRKWHIFVVQVMENTTPAVYNEEENMFS
ncbi:hypothetical protein E2C01_046813 [Portunus trituberculatus]|uniref:Uncharacterized protein n=1 Tax=Portunus trituberculatus TaxID=210409 RepID=A0A5B7G1Y0_PORTR|nr:hypothetical protein [Portunus trituberculatus]